MSKRRLKRPANWASPVGKKVLTGLTGLFLVIFVLEHMIGNLSYFSSDPDAYNKYAEFLHSLGPAFYLVELVLLAAFVFHIVLGINIYIGKRRARSTDYIKYQSAGGNSRQSVSSRSMIITGVLMLAFLILHLITFKYGPGIVEGYASNVDGHQIRDLQRLLEEKFRHPGYAFGYTGVMILLAIHMRHGIWSALQSLGAMNPRLAPVVYAIGGVIGVLVGVGFFVLPLWIYFNA